MLEVKNIGHHAGAKEILAEISFSVSPGTFTVVLGPNGAGKSSLLRLISRELKIQQGQIFFQQREIRGFSVQEMARYRAVMTQSLHMSSQFNVTDVVMMGRYPHFGSHPAAQDIQAVEKAIAAAGLSTLAGRNYASLSGGEQQRVQFARVMAQMDSPTPKTRLLMLDEPLNNLDIKYQLDLLEQARHFAKQGNIVLAVLHDINLAAYYADDILLLHRGRIQAHGRPYQVIRAELLEACYQLPVTVSMHPFHPVPVAYFGRHFSKNQPVNQSNFIYDTQIQH